MEERHLHFNLMMALWLYIMFVVLHNFFKFLLTRYKIPGLTPLVQNI